MTSPRTMMYITIFQSFHCSKNFMRDHFKSYSELNIETFLGFDTLDLLQHLKTSTFSLYHI